MRGAAKHRASEEHATLLHPIFLSGPAGLLAERPEQPGGDPPPVLFCDRDGTIIANRDDYVREAVHVEPLPGAVDALRRAVAAGFAIIVVSNQSPIGRGILSAKRVVEVHRVLLARLAEAGVTVSGSYLCPHAPEQGCPCRKPRPGMIDEALRGSGFDPARSSMVGDAIEDILAAGRRNRRSAGADWARRRARVAGRCPRRPRGLPGRRRPRCGGRDGPCPEHAACSCRGACPSPHPCPSH
jgi:histidinol-phosphate phosphatase family protein